MLLNKVQHILTEHGLEMKAHCRRSGRGRKDGREGEVHEKNSFATQASLSTCPVATMCMCVGD